MTHRLRLARERAGLSIGQAAKLLRMERDELTQIEDPKTLNFPAEQLAELYGVSVEWLTGESPQYDYARVDSMKGADKLTTHDRDTIAEFAASMPRRKVRECKDCGEPIAPLDVKQGFETCAGCAAVRRSLR